MFGSIARACMMMWTRQESKARTWVLTRTGTTKCRISTGTTKLHASVHRQCLHAQDFVYKCHTAYASVVFPSIIHRGRRHYCSMPFRCTAADNFWAAPVVTAPVAPKSGAAACKRAYAAVFQVTHVQTHTTHRCARTHTPIQYNRDALGNDPPGEKKK